MEEKFGFFYQTARYKVRAFETEQFEESLNVRQGK